MDKKEREAMVFKETTSLARLRGGESRRNVGRISGRITQGERPDFVIELDKHDQGLPTVLAVEHFRVDHFSELNRKSGHQDSLSAKTGSFAKGLLKTWNLPLSESDIPNTAIEDLDAIYGKALDAAFKASYAGYIRSFTKGFSCHVDKIDSYRTEVSERFPSSREVKIALLIELHSDFSDYFVHDGHRCYRPQPGELLLFEDMVDLMRAHRKTIDYVLLGFYGALKDAPHEAAIIRLALLEKSLKRNKLPIFRYLGEDRGKTVYETTQSKPLITMTEEEICVDLRDEIRGVPMRENLNACLVCLPLVIEACKGGQPFVTTIGVQMLLELYGDVLPEGRRIGQNELAMAQRLLGREEIDFRMRRFKEKWFPEIQE